jgi:Putative MetA-pathway of phenol degradation
MRKNQLALLLSSGLSFSVAAWAGCGAPTVISNVPGTAETFSDSSLGCVVRNLYGANGLILPNPTHSAHFSNDSQSNFTPLNSAIGTQLTLLPLVSPASGFTFMFDPAAGVYTRSSQTFGPILSERAETIGRHKVFIGFAFEHYNFNKIDGFDLHNFPVVFQHEVELPILNYEQDVIKTQNNINLNINRSTIFGTFGLTSRIDLSLAVPIVDASITATSVASIVRIGINPGNIPVHYFDFNNQASSITQTFKNSTSATGIGDVTIRGKGTLWKNETSGIAVGADLRLPTGDANNYLGSGAAGFKPFIAASTRLGRAAPHVNLGYEWNGSSVLAGNLANNVKASLPNQFFWTVGADIGVERHVTVALDILGQRLIDAPRLVSSTVTRAPDISNNLTAPLTLSTIGSTTGSFNIVNGSAGVKVSLGHNLLATANLLIQMNSGGLRDKLAPLFGLSYAF